MAKVTLYDLKGRLHTYQLPDGKRVSLVGKGKITIDESQVTDVMRSEAKAKLIAISEPFSSASSPVAVQRQTSKDSSGEVKQNDGDKPLEKKNDVNKGNKNKSSK